MIPSLHNTLFSQSWFLEQGIIIFLFFDILFILYYVGYKLINRYFARRIERIEDSIYDGGPEDYTVKYTTVKTGEKNVL